MINYQVLTLINSIIEAVTNYDCVYNCAYIKTFATHLPLREKRLKGRAKRWI